MDLEDQLESMMVNMNYIQSNVTDCQNSIMQMEEEAKVCTNILYRIIFCILYPLPLLYNVSPFSYIIQTCGTIAYLCPFI